VPAEPIWLHPEAIREARAAREWYSAWSTEAADAFMAEVDSAIEGSRRAPASGRPIWV
jgi:plasmid stabilization system protein ParE